MKEAVRGRLWLVIGIIGLLALAAGIVVRPRTPAIIWPEATPAPVRGLLIQEQGAGTPIPARQIMIPLYQYPKRYLTPAATDTWTLAASANFSNTVMAVIDPICNSWTTGSGGPTCGLRPGESPHPGSGVPDANMTTGMTELTAAGVEQLGYVSTYFGAQTLVNMKGQIDLYATTPYTAYISGIFFDEVSRYYATWGAYYTEIAAYAYAAGLDYVVLNINGWDQNAEAYFATPIANVGVMFEGLPADWTTYLSPSGTAPDWMHDYDRTNFAMILLDTPAANLTARLQEAYDRNYQVIFITDAASYTAAYETSPAYLPTEVAAWYTFIGTAAPTSTTAPTATPGPYLTPTLTPPVTVTTAPTQTPTATRTPMPSPTPPYWWTNNEGTPPGKWSYDDATPTPVYGATVVAVSTYTSPVQAYKVEGAWANDGWGRGGLVHSLATTATQGIFAGSVYLNSYNDWGGQGQFTPVRASGKYYRISQADYLSTTPWYLFLMPTGSSGYGTDGPGVWLASDQEFGEGKTKVVSGTQAIDAWYNFEIIWNFANAANATSWITATWASTTVVISASTGTANRLAGVTGVHAGTYDSYIYGTKPSVNLDDYWAVEGALTTPTPAPTATPQPQAVWSELTCPVLAVTVDGALTEWTAVVPYTLTLATAAYSWPITPTVPAGLAGIFRCAHNGALLYLSGVITDTTVVSPTGTLANGDAARVVLDGLADGDFRHLLDDHDLLIGSNGAVRNFEVYPIGATTVVSATAGGWQWEMSIPLATLEANTTTGEIVGLTFGYNDSEGGATWAHILTGAKRAGRLE